MEHHNERAQTVLGDSWKALFGGCKFIMFIVIGALNP
jgi:hypothetical protein